MPLTHGVCTWTRRCGEKMRRSFDRRGKKSYLSDPKKSNSRWLESSDRPRAAFQSFGEGPRICLGMRLAYVEEKVALLKLLSRFRVEKTKNTVMVTNYEVLKFVNFQNPIKLVGSVTVGPERVMVKLVKR